MSGKYCLADPQAALALLSFLPVLFFLLWILLGFCITEFISFRELCIEDTN